MSGGAATSLWNRKLKNGTRCFAPTSLKLWATERLRERVRSFVFRVSSSHASLLFREDRGENFTTECTENTEELLDMNDEIWVGARRV